MIKQNKYENSNKMAFRLRVLSKVGTCLLQQYHHYYIHNLNLYQYQAYMV